MRTKEQERAYAALNKERINANARARGHNTGEAHNAYQREWTAKNKEKSLERQARYRKAYRTKHPLRIRRAWRAARYGLTPEAYEALYLAQEGKCAICKQPEGTTRGKILCVEHDHDTKKVRALCCHNCNVALALIEESIDTAMSLLAYLVKHKQAG